MSKEVLEHALKTIRDNTQIYVFAYSWLNEENSCQFNDIAVLWAFVIVY